MTAKNSVEKSKISLYALIIGVSILGAAVFISNGLQSFRSNDRVVTVKGISEQDVVADLAMWSLQPIVTGNNLAELQAKIEKDQQMITKFLLESGFSKDEIESNPLEVEDLLARSYRPEGAEKSRYIISQTISLRTAQVDKIVDAVDMLGSLLRDGIVLANTRPPSYLYTKLNDIKPPMLREAVAKAQEAAAEFANLSGSKVGHIKVANQGVFQILPRDNSGYQGHETQKYKTVRVVSTITFFLK